MALTNKLSAIGNAIREKTGKAELLTLDEMATEITNISVGSAAVINPLTIESNGTYTASDCDGYSPITVNVPQDGAPTAAQLKFTSSSRYLFFNDRWTWFINKYGNQITTENLGDAERMFQGCVTLEEIPFELNFETTNTFTLIYMFSDCRNLKSIPKINGCKPSQMNHIFSNCASVRHFPEDLESYFNWTSLDASTSTSYSRASTFTSCTSMRSFPMGFLNHAAPKITKNSYTIYYALFEHCYSLDEVVGLPVNLYVNPFSSNLFSNTFYNNYRVKDVIFATQEDGTPYSVQWKTQTIDLTSVGTSSNDGYITGCNSGITQAKAVYDDATYQALKNDPDWFASNLHWEYSRYNHDSAVATINSLPDTSAYLATAGGTNTIKFKGIAGSATDGGAINTLTEEEIAVATAKGWTVTFV